MRTDWIPPVHLVLAGLTTGDKIGSVRPRGIPLWLLQLEAGSSRWFGNPVSGPTTSRGDLLLCQPDTPLDYDSVSEADPSTTLWIMFQPPSHWGALLRWPLWMPGIMRLTDTSPDQLEILRGKFEAILSILESGHPLAELRTMHAVLGLLLDLQERISGMPGTSRDSRIEACLLLMARRISDDLTVRDFAACTGLSPTRLNAVFKAAMGMSPGHYLAHYRMRRACALLLGTDRLIKQIAADVGYPDVTQFSSRFRKLIGVSPQAYRHRQGK